MKAPHLLRADGPPELYAPLFRAARAEGLRLGWLDAAEETPPAPLPERLEAAAALGALRAVAVGGGRSVAVKPLRGQAVLHDLLREHFRGCAAVLVAGGGAPPDAPVLAADGDGWTVRAAGAAAVRLGAEELVRRLRKPRPWGGDRPGGDRRDPSRRAG